MWIYRRVLFSTIIVCGLFLLGCMLFKLQVNEDIVSRRQPPEFLPNVARYRTSRVCSPRALVLVSSSPTGGHRRQVIRDTWAHPTVTQSLDISVAFGVGASDNSDVQRTLDWEAEIYGDIFQDPSVDTGLRPASRVAQLLKIARSACSPPPQFFLKTDDNVFVNSQSLAELLEVIETASSSNTMWCLEWNRRLDTFGKNDTWVVLKSQYFNDGYHPKYCVSAAYLMTGKALDAIIRRHDAQTGRTLLPEDVYITGILTKEAGTALSLLGKRLAFGHDQEVVDPRQVAFAYLGEHFEDGTNKLWGTLVKEKLNIGRRFDSGL